MTVDLRRMDRAPIEEIGGLELELVLQETRVTIPSLSA